ncbi:hypothetical protein G5V58_04510 [Nocardioides anomalus]|uniref:Uncharacterized protein n=1 Tax=Nocardioides anomalus TaxID=2712223 RepID=A0A6G6WA92_9ACTN|nr:hypothetical protein [Nocardioides anomalus]QIG42129.1 hypothetical protein G5V58_04510 [Nocardioides anomalus]
MAEGGVEHHLEALEQLVLWAGFLGAWLLVAGPLHQARVELGEEELERERYVPAFDAAGPPPRTSAWWWLVPPLRLYLGHRRKERWQREVWMRLPHEDFEALASFMSKARGWLLVGGGAFFIAIKETHELVEGYEWATWVFWVLCVAMLALCLTNTVLGAFQQRGVLEAHARQVEAGETAQ